MHNLRDAHLCHIKCHVALPTEVSVHSNKVVDPRELKGEHVTAVLRHLIHGHTWVKPGHQKANTRIRSLLFHRKEALKTMRELRAGKAVKHVMKKEHLANWHKMMMQRKHRNIQNRHLAWLAHQRKHAAIHKVKTHPNLKAMWLKRRRMLARARLHWKKVAHGKKSVAEMEKEAKDAESLHHLVRNSNGKVDHQLAMKLKRALRLAMLRKKQFRQEKHRLSMEQKRERLEKRRINHLKNRVHKLAHMKKLMHEKLMHKNKEEQALKHKLQLEIHKEKEEEHKLQLETHKEKVAEHELQLETQKEKEEEHKLKLELAKEKELANKEHSAEVMEKSLEEELKQLKEKLKASESQLHH